MNFISFLRRILKKYFPWLYNNSSSARNLIYKYFFTKSSSINVIKDFQEFAPNVSGEQDQKIENTIYNIQNFSKSIYKIQNFSFDIKNIFEVFPNNNRKLGKIFDKYGSDKKTHGYDLIYEKIFKELKEISFLFEIGIGSNNEQILSNMSNKGKPGSSLRAFRDYLDGSNIVGLEFDSNILFEEERIKTYHFDQNEISSLNNLPNEYLEKVDVLIDDGLHSVVANINSIFFAQKLLKSGGYLVIEDISKYSEKLYQLILFIAKENFYIDLYTNNSCFVALLKKK